MCTQKTQSLRSRLTFSSSSLQVALSLEDHSSEVQVVKHLLHVVAPIFPAPSNPSKGLLQAPCVWFHSGPQKALGSMAGSPGAEDVLVGPMKIPQPRMSLVSVLLTNVLPG